MSAIAALRVATWAAHQRLEKRLAIKASFSDAAAYRVHLEKMWGFCAVLEQRVERPEFGAVLGDFRSRLKLPLLARDLLVLGAAPNDVAKLPCCDAVPQCSTVAGIFGCAYVLEGATLGGRMLLPLVEKRLGFQAQHGAEFLASYGEQVGAKWLSFGIALDAWCSTVDRRSAAIAAAVATFDALDIWLCGPISRA